MCQSVRIPNDMHIDVRRLVSVMPNAKLLVYQNNMVALVSTKQRCFRKLDQYALGWSVLYFFFGISMTPCELPLRHQVTILGRGTKVSYLFSGPIGQLPGFGTLPNVSLTSVKDLFLRLQQRRWLSFAWTGSHFGQISLI